MLGTGSSILSARRPGARAERVVHPVPRGAQIAQAPVARSARAPAPAAAVLNWLWLTLAYRRLGKADEARPWLDKAVGWMDYQDRRMLLENTARGLHRHNWLEAHVLRQEAEKALFR